MITPDEIKKGLEHCSVAMMNQSCVGCPLFGAGDDFCCETVMIGAFAYIQRLERERDALLRYLTNSTCAPCDICKHDNGSGVMGCQRVREMKGQGCFEWRGICVEDTEEGENAETETTDH